MGAHTCRNVCSICLLGSCQAQDTRITIAALHDRGLDRALFTCSKALPRLVMCNRSHMEMYAYAHVLCRAQKPAEPYKKTYTNPRAEIPGHERCSYMAYAYKFRKQD